MRASLNPVTHDEKVIQSFMLSSSFGVHTSEWMY